MKKLTSLIKSLICASGIVFGLFCPFLSKAAKPDDMNEILQLEKVWNEAYLRGDADAIDRLCADDLIVTMTDMQILDKAKSLAIMRSGRVKFKRYETSELRIRVYANAAGCKEFVRRMVLTRVTIGDSQKSTFVATANGRWSPGMPQRSVYKQGYV